MSRSSSASTPTSTPTPPRSSPPPLAPCWPRGLSAPIRLDTELIELAEDHGQVRAWALEGASGYGAGLAAALMARDELVVELDRPARPARRAGAKSDPIDAVRAAREALARTALAQPRTGAERGALQVLLSARRAAVKAAGPGQRQLHALVVTAPEVVRSRFRGQSTRTMLATALSLRAGRRAADEVHCSPR